MITDKAHFIQYINLSVQARVHLECIQIPYAFFALRITHLLQTQFHIRNMSYLFNGISNLNRE
jgi:hypothetical protein